MLVMTDYFFSQIASGLESFLNTASIALLTGTIPPKDPDAAFGGDLTEAAYTGYGRVNAQFGPPFEVSPGLWQSNAVPYFVQLGAALGAPVTITGYALVIGGDGDPTPNIVAYEQFPDGPKTIQNQGDVIAFIPQVQLGIMCSC